MLKQNLTIEDFTIIRYPEFVRWEEIEKVLGKRRYKHFMKWMYGQTCVKEGVYPWDLRLYLEQINRGVKDPTCYD